VYIVNFTSGSKFAFDFQPRSSRFVSSCISKFSFQLPDLLKQRIRGKNDLLYSKWFSNDFIAQWKALNLQF